MGAEVGQLLFDFPGNPHGIAPGLLINLEEHGVVAVRGYPGPLGGGGTADCGNVIQAHQAIFAGSQHGLPDLIHVVKASVGHYQIELVVVL